MNKDFNDGCKYRNKEHEYRAEIEKIYLRPKWAWTIKSIEKMS